MALGSLTGALLAARRTAPTVKLVVVAAMLFAGVEVVIGLMPTYASFVVVTPFLGITAMTTIASANTVMQLTVPSELRGRVMALYLMVFMGGTPLGSPLIGWVGQTFGARWSLVGGALAAAAGTALAVALYVRARDRRVAAAREVSRIGPRPVGETEAA
jgi:MFS family permease